MWRAKRRIRNTLRRRTTVSLIVLDTSTSHLAIGIAGEDGEMLREFHADAAEGERGIHDARLASETAKLLAESGILAREISRVGLIIGPGSFTGLRIGLSFAKGFCFATGAGIVPLTPHEVMAVAAMGQSHQIIVTPGYREDLFYVSESHEPRNIRLLNGEAIIGLWNVPILLHDYFLRHPSPFFPDTASFVSPSLSTFARLTATSSELLREVALDTLEPLYLTEFKVTQ